MTTIICANCSNNAEHTYKSRNLKNPIHYCYKCLPNHLKKLARVYPEGLALDVPEETPKASKKKSKPVVEETVVEEAPAVEEELVADENNQD